MKVCSNSLIYLKLYFRSVRNPRFWKLTEVEVKLETKFSSFNLKKLVWVLSSVFHFWSKHQQLGFGSSQHSCFLWQMTKLFPHLHSWSHFHSWSNFHFLDNLCWQAWKCSETIAFLRSFPCLRSIPFPGHFVLASMEMNTSRLRMAWFESRQSNLFQVEQL